MKSPLLYAVALSGVAVVSVVFAQSATLSAAPSTAPTNAPAAAKSAAKSAASSSAYGDYRAWKDEPLESWREVNDRVKQLGGHRGHLAAASPDKSAADHSNHAAPADASKAAKGGMMQGGMHKGMDKGMHKGMDKGMHKDMHKDMHKGMQGGADKGAAPPAAAAKPPANQHKH